MVGADNASALIITVLDWRDSCPIDEEWSTGCRYLNMDEYFRWRADPTVEDSSDEEASLNGKQATQPTAMPA